MPPPLPTDEEPIALLDDSTGRGSSRLYSDYVRQHRCDDPAGLDAVWSRVDADLRAGLKAVLVADYDWGRELGGVATRHPGRGALTVLVFRDLRILGADEVSAFLARLERAESPGCAGLARLRAKVTPEAHARAIGDIHALIAAGETYQVNYTYRLEADTFGEPVALYRRLRARQPVAFGALIRLPRPLPEAAEAQPARRWILSLSPELFLQHRDGRLTARPMKGTAPRGATAAQDEAHARWLASDVKNRAENLMIVDLLRNDLGRVSQVGSVRVPQLFEVERYETVLQMTSTVEARLGDDVGFPDVLRASFPCGSITGAPKRHTMGLIDRLEEDARGLYTGAIGWVEPTATGRACGDFCLSVAIRTLVLEEPAGVAGAAPLRATLGVGGGIVADSDAGSEWAETRTKLAFLTGLDPGFTLFETMKVVRGRIRALDAHLDRLRASAAELGFAFDERRIRDALAESLDPDARQPQRLRLDLRHDGEPRITGPVALAPLPDGPVGVILCEHRLTPLERALAGHKTSCRSTYDAGIAAAIACGAFDALFFDDDGFLTEGGRSNVFVKIDGAWWTPPLRRGLLPGVQRGRLLRRGTGFGERDIPRETLLQADDLLICNALRGLLRVRLHAGR